MVYEFCIATEAMIRSNLHQEPNKFQISQTPIKYVAVTAYNRQKCALNQRSSHF